MGRLDLTLMLSSLKLIRVENNLEKTHRMWVKKCKDMAFVRVKIKFKTPVFQTHYL